jgi:threonine dehydratase
MHLRRRIAGERIGVVLSGGNITVAQLSQILHGELLPHAERAELLAAQLADMEYGARGT